MICKIDGCDGKVIGYGMCSKHYYRWKRNQGRVCSAGDCQKTAEIKGYCEPCYRARKGKNPEFRPVCTFSGCNKPQVAKGLCQSCYMRQRMNGTVERKYDGRTKHPLYRTWEAIIKRCTIPSAGNYKDYGAKGIRVCDRWLNDFWAFVADMGDKPSPEHTIERIEHTGHYEPGNCCWATLRQQARNKSNIRLNEVVVRQIKARYRQGERCHEIAKSIGAHYQTVNSVLKGQSWKDVD